LHISGSYSYIHTRHDTFATISIELCWAIRRCRENHFERTEHRQNRLSKMNSEKCGSEKQVQAIVAAIQCRNREELHRLLESDSSVFHWKDKSEDGNTLQHILAKAFGWNGDVASILQLTLQDSTATDSHGLGIFQRNDAGVTPVFLSLMNGVELEEIVWYLQHHDAKHLEENLGDLPRLIAEFCTDMTILENLLSKYPDRVGSLLEEGLYSACEFQNEDMIHFCALRYRVRRKQ
jgi:hypothetical protein